MRSFTEELIKGYAQGVGWKDPKVSYYFASETDLKQTSTMTSGTKLMFVLILLSFLLAIVGTSVELTGLGDIEDFSTGSNGEALFHAAKFRTFN